MAAPNLVNITTITPATDSVISTNNTALQTLLAAPVSGKVNKINALYVANTSGSTVSADVSYKRSAGTETYFCKTLSISANTTTVVITKDSPLYQIDTDILYYKSSSATGDLTFTVSYEILA